MLWVYYGLAVVLCSIVPGQSQGVPNPYWIQCIVRLLAIPFKPKIAKTVFFANKAAVWLHFEKRPPFVDVSLSWEINFDVLDAAKPGKYMLGIMQGKFLKQIIAYCNAILAGHLLEKLVFFLFGFGLPKAFIWKLKIAKHHNQKFTA